MASSSSQRFRVLFFVAATLAAISAQAQTASASQPRIGVDRVALEPITGSQVLRDGIAIQAGTTSCASSHFETISFAYALPPMAISPRTLDGYMEDLATDRIYRLMIAQRVHHKVKVAGDDGKPVQHSPELATRLFDEELAKIQKDLPAEIDRKAAETLPEARRIAEQMIVQGHHSPI